MNCFFYFSSLQCIFSFLHVISYGNVLICVRKNEIEKAGGSITSHLHYYAHVHSNTIFCRRNLTKKKKNTKIERNTEKYFYRQIESVNFIRIWHIEKKLSWYFVQRASLNANITNERQKKIEQNIHRKMKRSEISHKI